MSLVAVKIKHGRIYDIYAIEDGGKCELLDFVELLSESAQAEYGKLIRLFDWTADSGVIKNEQKFKRLTEQIWEFKTFGGVRVLCFFDDRRIIVLTNGFKKKKKYDDEIRKAENLMLRYQSNKRNESLTYREEP